MFIYKTERFTIYFGDRSQSITLDEIASQQKTIALENITEQLKISQFVFLHQNHGVQGQVIQGTDPQNQFFQQSGDYLITQKKYCGIGVVTADCLPIVMYDPTTHTAGIVHSGWKGTAANIFAIAVNNMIESCGTSVDTLQVYFGPAARPCCYEVQQDFVEHFVQYPNYQEAFVHKNNKIYFDSRQFISNIAQSLGIKGKNIYTTYNVCTICDTSFCSFRREKENARRQITLITLH